MNRFALRACSKRAGFTLVEILIVATIIALLVGLVGPRIWKGLGKGQQSAAKSQIETMGGALDLYRLDLGKYPTTQQGLQALVVNPGIEGWDGPYLEKTAVPKDPWGKEYSYSSPGEHGDYDLVSYGMDGQPGGEKEDRDIVSWE